MQTRNLSFQTMCQNVYDITFSYLISLILSDWKDKEQKPALDPEEMNASRENELNVAITEFFIYNSIIQHQIASAKPY